MPYTQLPEVYKNADLLLHTSLSEGQCEVVTEAMSAGVVVCGTRVGLMYDLPEACIGVRVGDYQSLAKEVLALLKDEIRMRELKRCALAWSLDHSLTWTVRQMSDIYHGKNQ
jgi:glycosyltransferase involved in cell wall biosynthesis